MENCHKKQVEHCCGMLANKLRFCNREYSELDKNGKRNSPEGTLAKKLFEDANEHHPIASALPEQLPQINDVCLYNRVYSAAVRTTRMWENNRGATVSCMARSATMQSTTDRQPQNKSRTNSQASEGADADRTYPYPTSRS